MSDQVPERPPEPPKGMEPKPSGHAAWRWPVVIVLLAARGLGAFVYVISTLIRTPERLVESAAKFRQGNITETFVASLPKLESERGGLLEVAKVTATETFRSEDERTYGFKWFEVDAGTTITEIRVPVTYR